MPIDIIQGDDDTNPRHFLRKLISELDKGNVEELHCLYFIKDDGAPKMFVTDTDDIDGSILFLTKTLHALVHSSMVDVGQFKE